MHPQPSAMQHRARIQHAEHLIKKGPAQSVLVQPNSAPLSHLSADENARFTTHEAPKLTQWSSSSQKDRYS